MCWCSPARCWRKSLSVGNAPLDYLHARGRVRSRQGGAVRHYRHDHLDLHRLPVPPVDDRRGHRRAAGRPASEEPRLYNLLENLCISRGITMPTLRIADDDALNAFATGINQKQYSITVTRGLIKRAQRPGAGSRARPRAHPYPQRRRAHDGDRGGDRRRDLVLRRNGIPHVLPERPSMAASAAAAARATARARAAPASPS